MRPRPLYRWKSFWLALISLSVLLASGSVGAFYERTIHLEGFAYRVVLSSGEVRVNWAHFPPVSGQTSVHADFHFRRWSPRGLAPELEVKTGRIDGIPSTGGYWEYSEFNLPFRMLAGFFVAVCVFRLWWRRYMAEESLNA